MDRSVDPSTRQSKLNKRKVYLDCIGLNDAAFEKAEVGPGKAEVTGDAIYLVSIDGTTSRGIQFGFGGRSKPGRIFSCDRKNLLASQYVRLEELLEVGECFALLCLAFLFELGFFSPPPYKRNTSQSLLSPPTTLASFFFFPVADDAPRCPQVPVLASFPSPLVPDTIGDERGGGTAISLPLGGQVRNGVVSPSRVRLREDMWVSSRTFYVLDAEVLMDKGGGAGVLFSFLQSE